MYLYLYLYLRLYDLHLYVYLYHYLNLHLYLLLCPYLRRLACVRRHLHVSVYVCTDESMYARTNVCMYVCVHVCLYVRVRQVWGATSVVLAKHTPNQSRETHLETYPATYPRVKMSIIPIVKQTNFRAPRFLPNPFEYVCLHACMHVGREAGRQAGRRVGGFK